MYCLWCDLPDGWSYLMLVTSDKNVVDKCQKWFTKAKESAEVKFVIRGENVKGLV